MDERSGTVRLVEPARDSEARGLVATVSRTDVEQAMRSADGQIDLLLDVERAATEGDGRETQRIALGWRRRTWRSCSRRQTGTRSRSPSTKASSSACSTRKSRRMGSERPWPCSRSQQEWPLPARDPRSRCRRATAPCPAARQPRRLRRTRPISPRGRRALRRVSLGRERSSR